MPPRRSTRTVPTVVVPGWHGSGDGHWQTWLEAELAAAGRQTLRPAYVDVDHPDLAQWLGALRECIADLPADGYDVVAHSLGAVLWLHHVDAPAGSPRAARVLLVAPPSPDLDDTEVAEFFPPPMDIDRVRAGADGTVLVGTDSDPFCPEGVAVAYGRPLKMATTVVEGGGHLNLDAGYGAWPAVLDWCSRENLAFF